jgi:hypothetical protein
MPRAPHLTAPELSIRWGLSLQTLANRRAKGLGPRFLTEFVEDGQGPKIRKAFYPLREIERFEREGRVPKPKPRRPKPCI